MTQNVVKQMSGQSNIVHIFIILKIVEAKRETSATQNRWQA